MPGIGGVTLEACEDEGRRAEPDDEQRRDCDDDEPDERYHGGLTFQPSGRTGGSAAR